MASISIIKYKQFYFPVAVFFILLLLVVIVGNNLLQRSKDLGRDLSNARERQVVLNQKVSVLSELRAGSALESAGVSVSLPSDNSSIATLTQVRSLARQNALVIDKLKIGPEIPGNGGLSRVEFSFEIEGPSPLILSFLRELPNTAPLNRIESVKISGSEGIFRADVALSSFWAQLPQSLPKLQEPITQLSTQEMQTLEFLLSLTPPAVGGEVRPQPPILRSDPFSL